MPAGEGGCCPKLRQSWPDRDRRWRCSSGRRAGARLRRTALNILPAGQYGSIPPPPGADRQAKMYDGLTPLFNRVTQSDLTRFFKSAALGRAPGATREERIPGHPGISIQRDEFNVPHIGGATDDDVTFAVGWVSAEDRGLLFEQARYNARAAAVDAPGLSALELTAQLLNFQPSARTEAEVAKQSQVLESKGEKGRQVLHDIDVYLAGANAYRRVLRVQREARHAHRHLRPQRPEGPVRGPGRGPGDVGLDVPQRPAAEAGPEQGQVGVQRPAPAARGGDRRCRSTGASPTRRSRGAAGAT